MSIEMSKLNIKNFSYFAFHPKAPLSECDKKIMILAHIFLSFTAGLGHLITAIVYVVRKTDFEVGLKKIASSANSVHHLAGEHLGGNGDSLTINATISENNVKQQKHDEIKKMTGLELSGIDKIKITEILKCNPALYICEISYSNGKSISRTFEQKDMAIIQEYDPSLFNERYCFFL